MNHIGQITTVIEDHVQWLAIGETGDGLFNTPVILFLSLALPCENGDTSCSDAKEILI